MSNIFATIKGSYQGLISHGATTPESIGSCHVHNHEDEILVKSFKYGGSNPIHEGTGRPLGQGRSKPFVLVKYIDKSTPLLLNAISNTEKFPEILVKTYQTAYNGKHEHYLTIRLKDAIIIHINHNNSTESIYFSYKTMTIEHIQASTVAEVLWKNAPLVLDKATRDRVAKRAEDNFRQTNDKLEEWVYDLGNLGEIASYALLKMLYNNDFNKKHRFIKNPLMSNSDFISKVWREESGKTRFKTPMSGRGKMFLRKVMFPAIIASFFFETGVMIGSYTDAYYDELLGEY